MNISIELAIRQRTDLSILEDIRKFLTFVNTINIPDIAHFNLRSWEVCGFIQQYYSRTIPHIKAIDFDLKSPFPLVSEFQDLNIREILVISGDITKNSLRPVYPTRSIDLIRKLKDEIANLTIFAGLDPYRQSLQAEYRYAMDKLEAGADGLFTQPFFDLRLMEAYASFLPNIPVYWGISPVLNERSKRYWETVNNVVFPNDLKLTMEWNRHLAKNALELANHNGRNLYYMPIRTNVIEYLLGIV